MKKLSFCVLILALMTSTLHAGSLSDADYTTPESWSQHFSPNGIVKSLKNHKLLDGTFNFSLTSRYKLDTNDDASDQAFYQYVRSSYTDLALGSGTVSANLFMRVGKDIDGNNGQQWGDNRYYFYNDILDAESRDNDWAARFYQGNITFDNVIEGTKLTVGRQYVDHINSFQIDGGNLNLTFLDGKLGFFAYGGLPVSYFVDTKESYLAGGGLQFKPVDSFKIVAEYVFSDILDDEVSVVKARADYQYNFGYIYAQYGNNDGKNFYELGTLFRNNPTKTSVFVSFEHLLDRMGESDNYFTNPLAYVLTPYGEYLKAKVRVQQGITDFLLVGVGAEYKDAQGKEDWDNRDYARYFANIDLVRFPFEGTYLTLMADYWDVLSGENSKSNNELTFGAELTQVINKSMDVWLGTTFDRYKYDSESGDYKDWIRSYYIGTQYRFNKTFAATVDFTYEDSQLLRSVGSGLVNDFMVQAWLNIAI